MDCVPTRVLAFDIVLQVADLVILVLQHGLDDIANGHHAHNLVLFIDHRDVADMVLGHGSHQIVDVIFGSCHQQLGARSHNVADGQPLDIGLVAVTVAHDISFGNDALDVLLAVDHHQGADIFLVHTLQGIADDGVDVNRKYLAGLVFQNLLNLHPDLLSVNSIALRKKYTDFVKNKQALRKQFKHYEDS